MQTHTPNVNVHVAFPIPQDKSFLSGSIKIHDEQEQLVNEYTMDAGDYGMVEYVHTVNAAHNDIGTATRGLRTVSMSLLGDDAERHIQEVRYYLASSKPLQKGENSLVSYVEALMLAPDLSGLQGWHGASQEQHVAALIESYDTLSRFPLRKSFAKPNITEYEKAELEAISDKIISDFAKAQMLHANYLLGGEPEKSMRDRGVMSNSVGESTTFFRTSTPLDYGISSRAYRYISRYLNRSVVLNNA